MHRVARLLLGASFACVAFVCHTSIVLSQDMTVYTTISIPTEEGPSKPVGRSLTLFHAGKVYDYMEDAGELVVFEPQSNRFLIVSGNYAGTRVEFTELNQFLKVARNEMQTLLNSPEGDLGNIPDWLRFQLDPKFEESSGSADRLTLSSPVMRYDVQTAAAPEPACVERYLAYADMAAQLNFVLHPGSTFPDPRMALNAALRRHAVLPVSVELESTTDRPVKLRASHKFQWELQSADKQHIHQWDRLLESKQIRWVSFHEYQERLLADAARRTK